MGGKAIVNAQRMSRKEYNDICNHLLLLDNTMMITYSLDTKESYGDVDVVVIQPIFQKIESISQTVKNGNITSIGLMRNDKVYQIDFTVAASKEQQVFLHTYLSYGIFGMCIGIALNKLNLQYGSHGLKFIFQIDKTKHYLLCSTSAHDLFEFLELDFERFQQGFRDHNALFDYMFQSPFISYESLHKKINMTKESNSKLDVLKEYVPNDSVIRCQSQLYSLEEAKEKTLVFFKKNTKYEELVKCIQRKKEIDAKFNGSIVLETLEHEIQGKEVGAFLETFRSLHDIENMTSEDIRDAIKALYITKN